MKKSPDPRIVSWALTGFVVGVLLTLVASGTVNRGSSSPSSAARATLPPAKPVGDAQLYQNVQKLVIRQLGQAYPNVKLHRLIQIRLDPVSSALDPEARGGIPTHARSVFIEFRLYDHPLGKSWRLRSAKADVFSLLKALYTSRLPIFDVELVGVFPLREGKVMRDSRALVAFIDHPTANRIPWHKWGRDNEARLWALLDYKHLDGRFA